MRNACEVVRGVFTQPDQKSKLYVDIECLLSLIRTTESSETAGAITITVVRLRGSLPAGQPSCRPSLHEASNRFCVVEGYLLALFTAREWRWWWAFVRPDEPIIAALMRPLPAIGDTDALLYCPIASRFPLDTMARHSAHEYKSKAVTREIMPHEHCG
jgi:hypothetical protein